MKRPIWGNLVTCSTVSRLVHVEFHFFLRFLSDAKAQQNNNRSFEHFSLVSRRFLSIPLLFLALFAALSLHISLRVFLAGSVMLSMSFPFDAAGGNEANLGGSECNPAPNRHHRFQLIIFKLHDEPITTEKQITHVQTLRAQPHKQHKSSSLRG